MRKDSQAKIMGHLEELKISHVGEKWRNGTGEEWEMSLAGWTDHEGSGRPG